MFEKPEYFLLFIALPFVVLLLVYDIIKYKRQAKAIAGQHISTIIPYYTEGQKWLKVVFYTLAFALSIVALARPKWGNETINANLKGRNVLVLLDVSYSMATPDVVPHRLDTARRYINELLEMESGDRIGLVVFSGDSHLLVPITHDYAALAFFLDSLYPGMLGKGGTNIAGALEDAVTIFDETEVEAESRMVLLMTDGEELQGNFDQVGRKLTDSGIRVFTIGVGTKEGEPIPIKNSRGEIEKFVKNENNEHVVSRLDEAMLRKIATTTGGSYMRSTGSRGEMRNFVRTINSVKAEEQQNLQFSQRRDRFNIFLIPALIFFVLGFILDQGRFVSEIDRKISWIFNKNLLFVAALLLVVPQLELEAHGIESEATTDQVRPQKRKMAFYINNGGFWGNRHFENGNYKRALNSYISAAERAKGNELAKLYYNIGNTFYRMQDLKNAGKYYEMAAAYCEDESLRAMINYNWGLVLFKLKKFGPAKEFFRRSLISNEDDDDARYNCYVSHLFAEKEEKEKQNQEQQEQQKDKKQDKEEEQEQQQQQKQKQDEQQEQLSQENIEKMLKALDEKEKSENRKSRELNEKNNRSRGRYW